MITANQDNTFSLKCLKKDFEGKSKTFTTFNGVDIGNGSILITIDDQKVYFFDAENKEWKEWK